MHNPVDWYAWKPEAFERAKLEDKPILVSIGYSTCHWCHVMEHESFEDETVAAYMNEHFINIKVDREERPDVDQLYMTACQVFNGSGGWPLNCFLLPDGKPFYAGTYFPPEPAYNRPSWAQVLQRLSENYHNRREVVVSQAERMTEVIRNSDTSLLNKGPAIEEGQNPLNRVLLHQIYHRLRDKFDREHGGLGTAPKFPATMSLDFLLRHSWLTGETEALEHVQFSLEKMIRGGIYDQLGGGFARYATDAAWMVPHFEKMLYDNALLCHLMAETYKLNHDEMLAGALEETLGFILREMTDQAGGFYSALDADSEGEEGRFYVWDKQEIETLLGEDAEAFCAYYGVMEEGNWEAKNILWRKGGREAPVDFAKARETLLQHRAGRVRPGLDDKVLLNWNALMCSGFVKASEALGNDAWLKAAKRNIDFLLDTFSKPDSEGLLHTWKQGEARIDAFLDDYAYLIQALIDVHEATLDRSYLKRAASLIDYVKEYFYDEKEQLFYFTSSAQESLILRSKDVYEGSLPSGNAVMAHNLQKMGVLMGRSDWSELAGAMLLRVADAASRYPDTFAHWASAIQASVFPAYELAVVGADASTLAGSLRAEFLPYRVLMASEAGENGWPLLEGKPGGEDTYIYVCRNYACQQPVETIKAFRQLIKG